MRQRLLPDRGAMGRDHGLLALAVTAGGPAANAGILVGDVLMKFDDTPIDSPEELMDLLMATGAGHRATLQVLRGAQPVDVAVTVGERPQR